MLHHLLSRRSCGKDEAANYVVLSANYHLAFHNWMGGMSIRCRPEDYTMFRQLETEGRKPTLRQPLAEDWELVP